MEKTTVVKCIKKESNSYGMIDMEVELSDGSTKTAFSYFSDELSFTSDELVGKTLDECSALFHKKDIEYLQS